MPAGGDGAGHPRAECGVHGDTGETGWWHCLVALVPSRRPVPFLRARMAGRTLASHAGTVRGGSGLLVPLAPAAVALRAELRGHPQGSGSSPALGARAVPLPSVMDL